LVVISTTGPVWMDLCWSCSLSSTKVRMEQLFSKKNIPQRPPSELKCCSLCTPRELWGWTSWWIIYGPYLGAVHAAVPPAAEHSYSEVSYMKLTAGTPDRSVQSSEFKNILLVWGRELMIQQFFSWVCFPELLKCWNCMLKARWCDDVDELSMVLNYCQSCCTGKWQMLRQSECSQSLFFSFPFEDYHSRE